MYALEARALDAAEEVRDRHDEPGLVRHELVVHEQRRGLVKVGVGVHLEDLPRRGLDLGLTRGRSSAEAEAEEQKGCFFA